MIKETVIQYSDGVNSITQQADGTFTLNNPNMSKRTLCDVFKLIGEILNDVGEQVETIEHKKHQVQPPHQFRIDDEL